MNEQTDLQWLLDKGVPVDNIARRVARTPTAIRNELADTAGQNSRRV